MIPFNAPSEAYLYITEALFAEIRFFALHVKVGLRGRGTRRPHGSTRTPTAGPICAAPRISILRACRSVSSIAATPPGQLGQMAIWLNASGT